MTATIQSPSQVREVRDLVRLPDGARATFSSDDAYGRRFITAGRARFVGGDVAVLVVDLATNSIETLTLSMWAPVDVEAIDLPW